MSACTTRENLWKILDLFEELSVTCWLDGGWGVDALYGKQTRDHRDIDINFDAAKTQDVLTALQDLGYVLDTDWLPVRAGRKYPKECRENRRDIDRKLRAVLRRW